MPLRLAGGLACLDALNAALAREPRFRSAGQDLGHECSAFLSTSLRTILRPRPIPCAHYRLLGPTVLRHVRQIKRARRPTPPAAQPAPFGEEPSSDGDALVGPGLAQVDADVPAPVLLSLTTCAAARGSDTANARAPFSRLSVRPALSAVGVPAAIAFSLGALDVRIDIWRWSHAGGGCLRVSSCAPAVRILAGATPCRRFVACVGPPGPSPLSAPAPPPLHRRHQGAQMPSRSRYRHAENGAGQMSGSTLDGSARHDQVGPSLPMQAA